MSNKSKEENPHIFQNSSESMERVKPRALLDLERLESEQRSMRRTMRKIKDKYGYRDGLVAFENVPSFNTEVDRAIKESFDKEFQQQVKFIAEHERFNGKLYREHLQLEAARERRSNRMRVLALFVGGILLGASTVGMCILGPTATAWTLPLVSTLGCFAVSLGLVLMGSIKSL